jgi:hypothetical protein
MGGWSFSLYPDAAEGGGSFRSAGPVSTNGAALDPPDTSEDAARRAKRKVRQYCAANRLNRLGTLTYRGEGQHSPRALRTDVGTFFRRLRGSVGEGFPYLWVPEWHKSGHGLHVHFAVGRYVRHRAIERAWGHGFVHIKLLGDLPIGSGSVGEARQAARYLSKYVGKDLASTQAAGRHRYEVAQGFQPRAVRLDGATADEVLGWAETVMGSAPSYLWRSRDREGWEGPPSVFASWD